MVELQMSRHACARARQRGLSDACVSAILTYGDRTVRRGAGCEAAWISRPVLARLGPRTPDGIDVSRLRNVYVLASPDEEVITIVRSRRPIYRRNARRF